jgi:hypothetical protein
MNKNCNDIYNKECTNIYILNHILIGFFIGLFEHKYILMIIIFVYQWIQFIFNIRFFIYDFKIKKGNSLQHTLNKLLQYLFGFIISIIVIKLNKKFNLGRVFLKHKPNVVRFV